MAQERRDIYQEVTNKVLEALEQGVVPWRTPIKPSAHSDGWPKSLATGHKYRGINTFLLGMTAWAKGYESAYWATFNQVKKQNGTVRKGEKGSLVIFWKQYSKADPETGEEKTLPVLRHFNVFHVEQCDGVKAPDQLPPEESSVPFQPIAECEKIARGYQDRPAIEYNGGRACYRPSEDRILIPRPERFTSLEAWYATLWHEFGHSTGAKHRLNREIGTEPHPFGTPEYGQEEFVAEFASAFLCAAAGISPPTIEQAAAYIGGWQKQIKANKKLVIQSAAQGQKAADYILGTTFNAPEPSEP